MCLFGRATSNAKSMMMKYDEHHRMEDKHSLEHNGTDLSIIMGKTITVYNMR